MKPLCTAVAALLLAICAGLADGADAPALVEWRADLSTTEVRNLYLRHGDSATLRARLYLRGKPYNPTNVVCFFATNGLASPQWWTAPATIASNTVSASWSPLLERGDVDIYPLVLQIDDRAYRAAAMLYLRASPGPEPDRAPFVIDFASVAYTNAPWALLAAVPAPSANDPQMDGAASPGSATEYARADHVHPAETAVTVDRQNPSLPASAYPITFVLNGEPRSAGPADIEYWPMSARGWTMVFDGSGICDFSAAGAFDGAWAQAEDLRFGGTAPVVGTFPALQRTVYVRGVAVPAMSDLPTAAAAAIRAVVEAVASDGADTVDEIGDLLLSLIETLKQTQENTP